MLRDAVLEFSGPLAASVGLAKTSERNAEDGCKFASVFMAASFKMAGALRQGCPLLACKAI